MTTVFAVPDLDNFDSFKNVYSIGFNALGMNWWPTTLMNLPIFYDSTTTLLIEILLLFFLQIPLEPVLFNVLPE